MKQQVAWISLREEKRVSNLDRDSGVHLEHVADTPNETGSVFQAAAVRGHRIDNRKWVDVFGPILQELRGAAIVAPSDSSSPFRQLRLAAVSHLAGEFIEPSHPRVLIFHTDP